MRCSKLNQNCIFKVLFIGILLIILAIVCFVDFVPGQDKDTLEKHFQPVINDLNNLHAQAKNVEGKQKRQKQEHTDVSGHSQ